jgi:wyosine [tRNA(Phe)-imidazoG37] synthetase (radical SAM superfamily)
LEVFLLEGLTSDDSDVEKLADRVRLIRPDRVQLNTVSRPTADGGVSGVPYERMTELASMFDPVAEVIADYDGVFEQREFSMGPEYVLEMLRRRPCDLDDVAHGLGIHRSWATKYLKMLEGKELVESETIAGKTFYRERRHR